MESPDCKLELVGRVPEYMVSIANDTEDIVTIGYDGTVIIHKEGGDKEAAKKFYDCLQIEGKTLIDTIKALEEEIEPLKSLKARVLGLDYYEEICIPWYQKYCHNSGRLKPLSDMIQKKIQEVVGDKNV